MDRVQIHCDPANERSVSVVRKLGFTHEATLRRRPGRPVPPAPEGGPEPPGESECSSYPGYRDTPVREAKVEGLGPVSTSSGKVEPDMDRPPFSPWRPHPWHGLEVGRRPPEYVNAYIEITPYDLIKYEVDKSTGYLRVDRPQRTSSHPPALYGFIPRTYCGTRVEALFPGADRGDGDPLDICVISERPISRSEVIVPARILGGIQLLDRGEADDKIIAVLEGDHVWRDASDLEDLPEVLVERLQHYFATYKLVPGAEAETSVQRVYGLDHAAAVVEAAMADYKDLVASGPLA